MAVREIQISQKLSRDRKSELVEMLSERIMDAMDFDCPVWDERRIVFWFSLGFFRSLEKKFVDCFGVFLFGVEILVVYQAKVCSLFCSVLFFFFFCLFVCVDFLSETVKTVLVLILLVCFFHSIPY
jgi:hypothetical protein